jgi:NAD(P)-dependent dehydrogenase (short-subunit alcohol dehydrogenase family)
LAINGAGQGNVLTGISSRTGVRLFAKAVAMECAAAGDRVRINTVHPGVIDTPIWTKISASAGSNAPIDPSEVAAEVAGFIEGHADKLTDGGRQRLMRHGHLPEREIMTGIGPVAVRAFVTGSARARSALP